MSYRAGHSGEGVKVLQQRLISLGYALPRWGADGVYGAETDEALTRFARDHGRWKRPGVANDALLEVVDAVYEATPQESSSYRAAYDYTSVVDYTARSSGTARRRRRPWSQITGITLHQTATCFLTARDRRQISAADLNRAMDRVRGIAVHGVVLRCGVSVYLHEPNWLVWQAQRVFNDTDIGIEIDGWFAGVEGRDSTFWRPASRPARQPMGESPAQTEAALTLIDFFVELVARHGGEIKHIHAHRQTSASRRSDPGELIWRSIAIPAMEKHGLDFGFRDIPGPDFFVPGKALRRGNLWTGRGPGRPIPVEWDDRATARY